jgi:hypothetical protein
MASTPLLGLSLPADGTTNWGTLVNTSITALIDSAIAGTTTLSSDADVTLTATTEATNQARQAILLCSGARTAVRTITAPAQSKTYIVINNTSGSFGVKIVGTGPTTGVTVPNGKAYMVAWDGSDFITTGVTSVNLATDVVGILPVSNGGTNLSSFTANRIFYASSSSVIGQSANLTFDGSKLSVSGVGFGLGAGAVSSNIAVGSGTLGANTTGTFNTVVGYFAATAGITANFVTAVGANALANNLSYSQTAVGYSAMEYMRGNSNVAVGSQALYGSGTPANNTGTTNVAIGNESLFSMTSGSNNAVLGYRAGFGTTTGYSNVGVGSFSLYSNTTGFGSVAIGYLSLYNMQSGGSNVGVGFEVMQGSGTPANNTGYNNVALGFRALYAISSAHTNVALGYLSGSAITTGTKNTILGSYSGNQGGLDIRTASNYIVLSDGDGNPRAYWNGANATFNGGLTLTAYLRTAVASVASAATITPTSDASNQYNVTALAVPATFAAPSGSPVDGQKLLLRIKDNGTARALTWDAIYRQIGTTLPLTTVATKTTYVGCVYNGADNVWDVVAVTTQA